MASYSPKDPSTITTFEELRDFVGDEFSFVAQQFGEGELVNWLRPSFRAPDAPREGMMLYADGTHFNPGSGKGIYEYDGGAWRPLYNPTSGGTYINITDPAYGGVGDGVTDNSAALTAAKAALGTQGGTIYFPKGKYFFNAGYVFDYPAANAIYDLTICGDGADASLLTWSGTNGLAINYHAGASTCNQSFHARDIGFTTKSNAVGTGLILQQASSTTGAANSALNELTRCVFRGDDGYLVTNSWVTALALVGINNINLSGCGFFGTSAVSGIGITYNGLVGPHVYAVVLNLDDCTLMNYSTALLLGDWWQGISIDGTNFTDNTTAISRGAGATGGLAQIAVNNSQFGCLAGGKGIELLSGVNAVILTGNLFIGGSGTNLIILNPSFDFVISGNNFQGGTTAIDVVSSLANTYGFIGGNMFIGPMTNGIRLQAGSANVNLGFNTFPVTGAGNAVTNPIVNSVNTNFGSWRNDNTGQYGFSIQNNAGSAGSNGAVVAAGARGTTDNSTVLLAFATGDVSAVVGSVGRQGTGIVINCFTTRLTPVTFANLPTPGQGMTACVTDSNTATPYAVIGGGGGNVVLAMYNGANWIVV